MNMTIILVLDDNDMGTQKIRSINDFPLNNPYKYMEFEDNGNILELYLLHLPGTCQTIEITLSDNKMHFNPGYEINIGGKCLIAISHFNDFHANDANNQYFQSLDYNQTILQGLPLFQIDYSANGWTCIDHVHSISASRIQGAGIDALIDDFKLPNREWLIKLYNNFTTGM